MEIPDISEVDTSVSYVDMMNDLNKSSIEWLTMSGIYLFGPNNEIDVAIAYLCRMSVKDGTCEGIKCSDCVLENARKYRRYCNEDIYS